MSEIEFSPIDLDTISHDEHVASNDEATGSTVSTALTVEDSTTHASEVRKSSREKRLV